MPLAPGTRLGPYEIAGSLGAGGMGEVYKARDTRLNRLVAIKILPSEPGADADPSADSAGSRQAGAGSPRADSRGGRRARFEREARAVAALNHPHICTLFDIGEAVLPNLQSLAAEQRDGRIPSPESPPSPSGLAAGFGAASLAPVHYLVMEYLEGQSLAERLQRGPLPLAQALELALQITDALQAAHDRGIIHRDLKPGNVMLVAGTAGSSGTPAAKLLDFGIAKLTARGEGPVMAGGPTAPTQAAPVTAEGMAVGTLHYMAPEQIQGQPVDQRTDIFAMGALLFEMVMGSRAFPGRTPMEVYHRTLYEQPPALGGSPAAIAADRVIRRALAKKPEDRYSRAADMAEAIRAIGGIEAGGATRAHAITRLIALPFRALRPDPDTDFLAVSLPDAIACALAGLESLVVRSSAAAARFSGHDLDLRRIAEEADVDVVLTGTLVRAGEQVRVTAQLVEAPEGTLLWSQAPQVALRDVFQLQDQIVDRIVESLSLSLTAREHKSLKGDVPASPTAYEFFLRGNELILSTGVTSAEHLHLAREFYERCLQADPHYAPGWARLGRCQWLIGKGGEDPDGNVRRAEASFGRALEINPDLPLALNLHALLDIDQGRAEDAMVRLVTRGRLGSSQPELYAALVQACRFCGLLEASVAAHARAEELDRNILTSVDHAWWQLRDYTRVLEYVARRRHGEVSITNLVMRACILGELGRTDEAISQFRDVEQAKLTDFFRDFVCMHRALVEGRREDSLGAAERLLARALDADTLWQAARVLAYFGESERALAVFSLSLERGFILYRILTRVDPWLDALRPSAGFSDLLRRSESRYRAAAAAFRDAGGEQLLGVGPAP